MSTKPSIALVTGGTSGIGRATALQLARDGFEVVVHGRDAARGKATVDAIVSAGGRARFLAADLSDPEAVTKLAREAGEVDVLINNAGISWFGPTADLTPAHYDALFAANVRAVYFLVAALAPKMVARGHGSIVSVGSLGAAVGFPSSAAYSATKAALEGFTRAWAAEFSPRGVRVNTVAPGPTYTSIGPRDRTEALGKTTLLDRAANDSEIAEVIAFLASDRASYVTGAVVPVDGGRATIRAAFKS